MAYVISSNDEPTYQCIGGIEGGEQCPVIHPNDFEGACPRCKLEYKKFDMSDLLDDTLPLQRRQAPIPKEPAKQDTTHQCGGIFEGIQCTAIHSNPFVGVCPRCGLEYYEIIVPDDA
jgi:hypothetical protein